jgi:type I restriction-modification system DNA methylase subunit
VLEAIAPNGRYRVEIAEMVEDYARRRGYSPAPGNLAREMAYVLLNKIVFYKILERFYGLPKLQPLYREGEVRTVSEYLKRLRELFDKAVEVTRDYEAIFHTGLYDAIDIVESENILEALDYIIGLIDYYEVEKFGDIIGYVYEDLILDEERHQLGQFYTPRPIAELIVKWAIRSPDDKILDPGCGSGTFLVEAYKRLAELKLKRSYDEIEYVPSNIHRQILNQLYGIDINEFPAHLTAINLAMRNPRAPSDNINIFVKDYFTVIPGQKLLAPYRVVTPEGRKQLEVEFKDFDAVVGNPPYTRWTEIINDTQDTILRLYRRILTKYNLTPQVQRGVEPGIYVYWIIHSTGFLKEGGRLAMIISNSWLQADYGINFGRFLLDNYKVKAVIDISTRVFPVPLIGTCIVLMERETRQEERMRNNIVFMRLRPRESINVDYILKLVEEYSSRPGFHRLSDEVVISVVPQEEVYRRGERWINYIFNSQIILEELRRNNYIAPLGNFFEVYRGNTVWSMWAIRHGRRPDVGGEEFFYLTKNRVKELNIPDKYLHECLHPLLPSSRYAKFFTFTEDDWKALVENGVECYLFLCHKPRADLPDSVRRYIEMAEGPNATIRLRRRPGEHEGRPVSESQASQARREQGQPFYDWYDLGGVIEAPIFVSRGTQYWIRFVLSKFNVALDDRILALIPRQGVSFSEVELKALLAYLNSSFSQLQAEVRGRSTGGGMIELDVKSLSEFLVLDVRRLGKEDVEKLASLFDKLEAEARRLGGADTAENIYGSELAKELTGRANVRSGVVGLFNTVIKEIDYEIGRILGLDGSVVEATRSLVLELSRRRLSRAQRAEVEAIRGTDEQAVRRPRRRRENNPGGLVRRLDEFL